MTIADKIAILDDGKLQQLGTPAAVFNEPTNLFVAQFVGSPNMNTFDATMTNEGDTYRVDLSSSSFSVPAELLFADTDVTDVTVGFRPQDLFREESSVQRGSHDGPTIDSEVNVIEPLGTDAIVHSSSEEGDLTATITRFHEIAEGDAVQLTVAPEHIYLFDRNSGELLKGRLDTETSETETTSEVEA